MRGAVDGRGLAQPVALTDAEAVLFVDDDEPQVVELDGVLDDRVGADDDRRLSRHDVEQRCLPGRRRLGTGEEGHPDACLAGVVEEAGEGPGVLGGEHLGRGEEGALEAGVDGAEHGEQGHDRLT